MKQVVIGGIGNVLLGDDGVGPYVARLLAANYEFDVRAWKSPIWGLRRWI